MDLLHSVRTSKATTGLSSSKYLRYRIGVRFLVAGAINTLFGLAVFALFILLGAPHEWALALSLVSGTVFNFVTYSSAFRRRFSWPRALRFLFFYICIYTFNLSLLRLLLWLGFNPLTSQAILTPLIAVLVYYSLKRVVFKSGGVGHGR